MASPEQDPGPAPAIPLTGGCMCGAVAFELSAPLLGAAYCHCKRCQRRTGTGWSTNGRAAPGSLRVTRGEDVVGTYRPDDGWHKSFCGSCGSQLWTRNPADPDMVAVRFGALDQDPGTRPDVHQFVDYAAPWAPVPDDGLPRFPERMSFPPPGA